MFDQPPVERLQPCLLDRLTDDDPLKQEESSHQRVISHQKYKRGVLRDLEWLFNTPAYLHIEGLEPFRLRDYPEAWKSVINFGIHQLSGATAPNLARVQEQLNEAIQVFE